MALLRGFIFAMAVLLTSSPFAASLTVDLNGGADYTDIQPAIDAAATKGEARISGIEIETLP